MCQVHLLKHIHHIPCFPAPTFQYIFSWYRKWVREYYNKIIVHKKNIFINDHLNVDCLKKS